MEVVYAKPSAAWRRGTLLCDGWPAQQRGEVPRSTHDLRFFACLASPKGAGIRA